MRILRGLLAVVAVVALGIAPAAAAVKVQVKTVTAKTKAYALTVHYPVTGVATIDAALGKFIKDKLAEYKTGPDDSTERAYEFELSYDVARNDSKVFAVLFNEYSDSGGAHPNSYMYAFNFLMPDGAQVFLPEIVDGKRGIARVSDYAVKDLTKRIGGPDGMSDAEWLMRGAGPLATNFDVFILKPNSIEIQFPSYQVAAYAAGPQETTVPLSYLKSYIRKDWRAPQASFDCTKAKTPIERTICSDASLARADRQAAEKYAGNLANAYEAAEKDKWRTTQRAWLAERDKLCASGDAACLRKSYAARMTALQKYTP